MRLKHQANDVQGSGVRRRYAGRDSTPGRRVAINIYCAQCWLQITLALPSLDVFEMKKQSFDIVWEQLVVNYNVMISVAVSTILQCMPGVITA